MVTRMSTAWRESPLLLFTAISFFLAVIDYNGIEGMGMADGFLLPSTSSINKAHKRSRSAAAAAIVAAASDTNIFDDDDCGDCAEEEMNCGDIIDNNSSSMNMNLSANAIVDHRRRGLLASCFRSTGLVVSLSSLSLSCPPAAFAAASQEQIDKANVVKGYQRLQYLLDNWEKETTVCGMGGDKLEVGCDRTPLKVMDYMGFKSTKDPLYNAPKALRRLYESAPNSSRDGELFEAVEKFAENAEDANGLAFVSSWGEANPGGGKDRVELFIERAKRNVILSRDSLATVIDILDLKP